jgi:hypothetical protein
LPGRPIEHVDERLLRDLRDYPDAPTIDRDVRENRRCREVVVPDAVMDGLEMPDTLPGLDIKGHQAFGKEVVAGTRAAVVVAGWRLDRQVHVTELFVGRHRRPDRDVAGVGPRVVQPGLVP